MTPVAAKTKLHTAPALSAVPPYPYEVKRLDPVEIVSLLPDRR